MNPNNIFFVSDTHFGHAKIMQYSKRPWIDVQEMDKALIENWNNVVPERGSHVFHIGDIGFWKPDAMCSILRKLHGQKYLLIGNHDRGARKLASAFAWIKDYYELTVLDEGKKQKIVLHHYPLGSWHQMHYGSWNIHGHCHGNYKFTRGKQLDVGVDALPGYKPHSYYEIREIMATKEFVTVDHHELRGKKEEGFGEADFTRVVKQAQNAAK